MCTWSGRDTRADHGVGFIVDEHHSQAIVEIIPTRALLRLERTMNLLEGGKGGGERVGRGRREGGERGWGGGEREGGEGGGEGREG